MTHDTDALVSDLRQSAGRRLSIRSRQEFSDLLDRAADAIARLTRERDEFFNRADEFFKRANSEYARAETAEAALSAARAELAGCRSKALEEAAIWHDDLAAIYEKIAAREKAAERPGKFLQADSAYKRHTVYAARIRALKEAPHE